MTTECKQRTFTFHPVDRREVIARFDGGDISSDGGALLLRETERRIGVIRRFAECFTDHRNRQMIEHSVAELVAQRVFGLALGYEDLNDHDDLRRDPLLAVAVGKRDLKGERRAARDRGCALAGKSTLNRLELTHEGASSADRYKKIELDFDAVDQLLVETFLRSHATPPDEIILDLDATDDPLHGNQEGLFFHGYYDSYCYLPLYILCGEHLLCARLRKSNIDASAGSLDELAGIVAAIRQAWPQVRICIRADSGFCREEIMAWCENHAVDFILGLARNPRLERLVRRDMNKAMVRARKSGDAYRIFKEFRYSTRDTWSRKRRVIAKVEALPLGGNPRFIVTSFSKSEIAARRLYEQVYCARGQMENKIKEQKLLFSDRTSTHGMRSNQVRVYFSAIAYVLMSGLRRLGLAGTDFENAQCDTIRTKLLKIGAHIALSVRRVVISFSSACPYAVTFALVYDALTRGPPS